MASAERVRLGYGGRAYSRARPQAGSGGLVGSRSPKSGGKTSVNDDYN